MLMRSSTISKIFIILYLLYSIVRSVYSKFPCQNINTVLYCLKMHSTLFSCQSCQGKFQSMCINEAILDNVYKLVSIKSLSHFAFHALLIRSTISKFFIILYLPNSILRSGYYKFSRQYINTAMFLTVLRSITHFLSCQGHFRCFVYQLKHAFQVHSIYQFFSNIENT